MFKIQFEIENNLELPSICLADPYFGPTEKEVTVHEGEVAFFNCPVLNLAPWQSVSLQPGNLYKSALVIVMSKQTGGCHSVKINQKVTNIRLRMVDKQADVLICVVLEHLIFSF